MKIYLGLLMIVSIFGINCGSDTAGSNSQSPNEKNEINKNAVPEVTELVEPVPVYSEKVTDANFQKVKNGMSLKEVEKIFDDKGANVSNDLNVDKGELVYEFLAPPDGKGKALITFKDGKVIKKAQTNLK